jgi:hypothetical protein
MAELVAVKYRGRRRLHAGDTWELYVGKDGRAEYFVYHRGGAKKPSLLLATWGGQKRQFLFFFQPITAATPTASRYGCSSRTWRSR